MSDILARLAAPFPPSAVSWRVTTTSRDGSKGMAACYIDARDVQARLDAVMGPHWANELLVQPGLVTCRIGLYIDGQWVWRQDGSAAVRERAADGANSKPDAKADQAREMSLKGSASDALKRTAVLWGIGRYLYSIDSPWVAINEYKQIVNTEMPKLRQILERHYADWLKAARPTETPAPAPRPVANGANGANGHSAPPPSDLYDGPADDRGDVSETVEREVAEAEVLDAAMKNADFRRIYTLITKNTETIGDVTRIVNAQANLDAIKSWPEPWKAAMRTVIRDEKLRCEKNRPAPEDHATAA